jgi:hypothetical protein
MYEPIGRWVRSAHGSAIGGERKNVKVATGIVWWVGLKRAVSMGRERKDVKVTLTG